MYRKVVLDNGVRVVFERMSALKSVAIGIWTDVGARDEGTGEQGLSHFLEHMMFKGTRRRSAGQISHEIDALGGEMNAFTSHETTTFYVKVLDQQLTPALDLLSDLFHHSRFDPKEIEKEKHVVLEEIKTVRDDPEDFVHELHANHVLRGHPLGRPVLGDQKTMKRLRRQDLLRYVHAHYRPEKTVLSVAGNVNFKELIPLLNEYFGVWKNNGQLPETTQISRCPPRIHGGTFVHGKRLEQVHLCLGFKGLPSGHPQRYAAHVLNAILGGGMSSRLFQEVREKRGLAYTIYSHLSSFSDGGVLTVYAATSPQATQSVVELVCREVQRFCKRGVSPQELERTKTQMKSNVMLGLEGTYGRMNKLAKDELYQGHHVSLSEMVKEIDRVSSDQILQLSRELLDLNTRALTVLGLVPRGSLGPGLRAGWA